MSKKDRVAEFVSKELSREFIDDLAKASIVYGYDGVDEMTDNFLDDNDDDARISVAYDLGYKYAIEQFHAWLITNSILE